MQKYIVLILVVGFLAGCTSDEGQPDSDSKAPNIAAIDSLINAELEQDHFAGAVVRVQKTGKLMHRKAYGYAQKYNYDLEEMQHPEKMTAGHLFDLASLTKVFGTTFGVMILNDQGKIKLDDPIYKWFPAFNTGEKKAITIRHLLTHSAGLYQWKPTYYFASNKQSQYDYIARLPLKWKVGEGRHYSDLGFILLGQLIEKISGRPLDEFLEEHLYEPLNLHHTAFNPNQKGFKKIAATSHGNPFEHHMVYDADFGYTVDVDPASWDGWRNYTLRGEVNDGNAWYASGGVSGHAGLFSTAGDLQKLLTLLVQKGTYEGKQLIDPAVIDTFLTRNKFNNGLGWAMDPGVISTKGAPDDTFGHTGFTGTNVVVMPKDKWTIIMLTNRQNVGVQPDGYYYNLSDLRQKIVSAVLKIGDSKKM